MSDYGVQSYTPQDGAARLAAALGGRVRERAAPPQYAPAPGDDAPGLTGLIGATLDDHAAQLADHAARLAALENTADAGPLGPDDWDGE